MDAAAMRSMVEPARVARLATVSVEGGPHLVPVCFVLVGDTVYSAVDHKPKKSSGFRLIANIRAPGGAGVLVAFYHPPLWPRGGWARLAGGARLVDNPDEAVRARSALVGKYPQYARTPPSGPLIALDITRWTGWSADEP